MSDNVERRFETDIYVQTTTRWDEGHTSHSGRFIHEKIFPVLTEFEAGWKPQPAAAIGRREKLLSLSVIGP